MTNSQIATLLNTTIVPNLLGEETTIAEDLSNFADLGTPVENLTADQLKDYTGGFVAGVLKTYYDERIFNKTIPGLYKDYTEWGGIIQRVKAGLSKVTDDVSQNLQNGTSYDPNVYVGFSHDNIVYTKDISFELDWSVPNNMWRSAFKSVDGLRQLISYIYNRAENTMNVNLYAGMLGALRSLIASKPLKRVKMVSIYNQTFGTQLTPTTATHDSNFLKWATETVINLKRAITDVSTKYNDGTVETFTPGADTNVTLLSQFATALEINMQSGIINKELVSIGDYSTVNYWQNSSDEMLTPLSIAGQIHTSLNGSDDVEIENCIGVIYDKFAVGVTSHPEKVTSQYNAKGDFTNYFRRIWANVFVATNQNAIVLTLE